jgi:translocation protein SEC63
MRTLQELRDVTIEECAELLTNVANFSTQEAMDVELVLQMIPTIHLDLCTRD